MNKNDIFTTEIIDMTEDGEGIGKIDGFTVFVKDAVIGDVIEGKLIKVKKTYAYAKVEKVSFENAYYRRDIGKAALRAKEK